jgi:hypothetical protein
LQAEVNRHKTYTFFHAIIEEKKNNKTFVVLLQKVFAI